MQKKSRTKLAVAVLTAVAMTAASTPSFAHSKQWCRDYARGVADHGKKGLDGEVIVPIILLAGAGAVVGAVVPGLAISAATGAMVGGGTGAVVGVADHAHHNGYRDREYAEAYADCRAGRVSR